MTVAAPTKPGYEEPVEVKLHKIRITLTSRNVKNLEKGRNQCIAYLLQQQQRVLNPVCSDLINRAKDKELKVKGPVRLPTKNLRIVSR